MFLQFWNNVLAEAFKGFLKFDRRSEEFVAQFLNWKKDLQKALIIWKNPIVDLQQR
jgi:hypothetical protein